MNYEKFKTVLADEVKKQLPEEAEICLCTIQKNNGVLLDAMSIRRPDTLLAPAIYLDGYYQDYCKGSTVAQLAEDLVNMEKEVDTEPEFDVGAFVQWEKAKQWIFSKVINYGKNEGMLRQIPHIRKLDLAVVFYYQVQETPLEEATILIRESHRESWEVTLEELYETACENDRIKNPPQFQDMEQLIRGLMNVKQEESFEQKLAEEDLHPVPMYVLTNSKRYFGAVCIFYDSVLECIADYLKSDFFILPSSIHECIIVPDSGNFSRKELRNMVREVNETQVEPQEFLSNQVYYYHREERELSF